MRVLITTAEVGKGGSEPIRHLMEYFNKNGIEYEYVEFKGKLHHLKNVSYGITNLFQHSRKCDVAVSFTFPSYFYCALLGIPTVYYCFEPQFYIMQEKGLYHKLIGSIMVYLEKKIMHKTFPVVNDEANQKRFKEVYGISPIIIPYGIDYEFWLEKRDMHKPFDAYPVIFHVGEVQQFKNQEMSLYVLKTLQENGLNVHLHFYGKIYKPYLKRLEKIIKENDIRNVIFCGDVDRETLRRQYTECNVLIHPIKLQGGVLTPYEAMCAGVPVITSFDFSEARNISNYDLGYVSHNIPCDYATYISMILEGSLPNPSEYPTTIQWIKEKKSWKSFCEKIHFICEGIKR